MRRLSILVALAGCGDDAATGLSAVDLLPRDQCVVAVVASDYRSSALSLLDASGAPCVTDLVHSGSRAPGLVTALSGDVVLPTAWSGRRLPLVDRFNGVMTLVDVDSGEVERQFSVVGSVVGNPQDVLALGDGSVLVSQLQGDGADLVRLDLADGRELGSVDLSAVADPGLEAQPTRLARTGATLWAGLAHLDASFTEAAGPGRVVSLSADGLDGVVVTELPGLVNCANVVAAPDGSGVWVACAGFFQDGYDGQVARSGVAFVDADGQLAWSGPAGALVGAPFGFALAALDASRLVAVGLPVDDRGEDQLVVIDRRDDRATVLTTTRAFGIWSAVVSDETLLVAIADPNDPHVMRWTTTLAPLSAVRGITRSGLQPQQLLGF